MNTIVVESLDLGHVTHAPVSASERHGASRRFPGPLSDQNVVPR